MKRLLIVPMLMLLAGCAVDPVSRSETNNPKVRVDFVLEHDGCKVYRFRDGGYKRYFVKCEQSSRTMTTMSSGKTNYPYEIQTEYSTDSLGQQGR